MNGDQGLIKTITSNISTIGIPSEVDVVLAPPFPYLSLLKDASMNNVKVAAQNVNENLSGAFTGEVSVRMLMDLQIDWVIIGHSERRTLYKESDELVGSKVRLVLNESERINVIVCVGETLTQYEAGLTRKVLEEQLNALLSMETSEHWSNGRVVIAYEPVWAIGTGKAASPDDVTDRCRFLDGFC